MAADATLSEHPGNLIEARSGDRRERFAYDPAGAIVGALERVGEPAAKWKLGPGNRLLETTSHAFTFDKRGRRSSKRSKVDKSLTDYAWDVRDRLREVRQPDGSRVRMVYDAFGRRIHDAELAYTLSSVSARTALAENYVGLPY